MADAGVWKQAGSIQEAALPGASRSLSHLVVPLP